MAHFFWSRLSRTLQELLQEHLSVLHTRGYSPYTIRNRLVHIRLFVRWCSRQDITSAAQINLAILERYQTDISNSEHPIRIISQQARLVPLRVWFAWMYKAGYIRYNPAERLQLPRLGRHLPRNILSAAEVERIMRQPSTRRTVGLRDRAILEMLYSTGIRRLELMRLQLADLHLSRGLIFVNEGKGRRDRYVPIGRRAVRWVRRYLRESRPRLTQSEDEQFVFLSAQGRQISRDQLTWIVRKHVKNAKLGKSGACHLFRHTMATLMHENGADIRVIQQILGHTDIKTTQIYTQVAIPTLQRIHARTHPAA
ncbi:MAG TPA: tyrosine-type recombinase/integrase [Terriglobales bacterium]